MKDELFLIYESYEDFPKIYGIYDNFVKAMDDFENIKKYISIYGKLRIYKINKNEFIKDFDKLEVCYE